MKKIVGLILTASAVVLGLTGLSRKESSAPASPTKTTETWLEHEHANSRAIYFASGGTLTINGNQATFKQPRARD
jgi:hypothetical protein